MSPLHSVGQMYDSYGAPACSADFPGEEPLSTGTTILAAEYDGGIMIAADSRTSTGPFVANRVTDKLSKITETIYVCRSGSAADTQALADIVAYHLDFHRNETGEEPTVLMAAELFRDLCYKYRSQLMAGLIVAGWDKVKGGQVYVVPLGGMLTRQKVALGGSGSTYIYGFMDANFRENMTEAECRELLKKSVALAISRDNASGGVIRMGIIRGEMGLERELYKGAEVPEFPETGKFY